MSGDMIEDYKYTHGLYDVSASPVSLDQESVTRDHSHKMCKQRFKI